MPIWRSANAMQAEAGMVIWVAQGAVGLLTGRETRKAEEMCRETWRGLPLPPTLCTLRPVRALPLVLVRASVSGWTMVSPHACMHVTICSSRQKLGHTDQRTDDPHDLRAFLPSFMEYLFFFLSFLLRFLMPPYDGSNVSELTLYTTTCFLPPPHK